MKLRVLLAAASAGFCAAASAVVGDDSHPRYSGGFFNYDAHRIAMRAQSPKSAPADLAQGKFRTQYDSQLGLPTFIWAKGDEAVPVVGALQEKSLLEARARDYLRSYAGSLHLSETMIADARAVMSGYNGQGPAVVKFRQRHNGLEVARRELNVMMDRAGKLVAISGYFATDFDESVTPGAFLRSPQQGIAAAFGKLGGTLSAASLTLASSESESEWYAFAPMKSGLLLTRQPRLKRMYYPVGGKLVPAYYSELFMQTLASSRTLAYGTVISALDDSLLSRQDLVSHAAYSYRVFADTQDINQPFDSPLGNGLDPFPYADPSTLVERVDAGSALLTLDHGPISTGDPWITADGATELNGNNANAYIDNGINVSLPIYLTNANAPTERYTALTGDFRASNTGVNAFDYPIAADDDPATDGAKNAANVTLFYMNNWMHDWWYDHGFDETSGNAQVSNYGRGGEEDDAIEAQGQDSSGRNNANMAAPSDGNRPVMQMYLFDGPYIGEVSVTAPYESGALKVAGASFGPKTFDLTGEVALANDAMGDSVTDGCSGQETPPDPVIGYTVPIAALPDVGLAGKIALIDRGTCNNTTKELFATLSGASAMVVVNNVAGDPPFMGNGDIPIDLPVIHGTDFIYTLPAVRISLEEGQEIKDALAAGQTVTMHLKRDGSRDFDGTIDHQIIAHEFFHYVSNRLVGNGTGLNNNQGGGMGEGWSDVNAMLMTVREEDALVPGNEKYQGAYGLAGYVENNFYNGIRRAPYSTDFAINAYTFKHIQEGEPTPGGGSGVGNSEVHSTGEIWANMVWNCYAGILNNDHSFLEARSLMQDYLIAGLKMTPVDPTILAARDGLLAAVQSVDAQDFAACSHGFAVRGAGVNAVGPASDSADNVGVVEDYTDFVETKSASSFRFGGALNLALLLPLLGLAVLRRRH